MVIAAGENWMLADATGIAGDQSAHVHEIRVGVCLARECDKIILRCSCGDAWEMETGHTVGELNQVAAQHSAPF